MEIALASECFYLLLEYVPVATPAFLALAHAIKFAGTIETIDEYQISCTKPDTDIYLATAKKFFPERIVELQRSIALADR